MAFKPTIRGHRGYYQAGEGISVDGLALDRRVQDMVDFHNSLPRGVIGSRWARQVYHLGWEPPVRDTAAVIEDRPGGKLPWMRVHNAEANTLPAGTDYAENGENPWRHKGHDVTVIDPFTRDTAFVDPPTQLHDQYAWTTALSWSDPVVLDEMFLLLETTAVDYDNSWQYPQSIGGPSISPATQITDGLDWVSDIVLQAQVDSDLGPNHAEMSDLEVNFYNWRADGRRFRQYNTVVDTMIPRLGGANNVQGLVLRFSNLNVPIPEFARVRFSVILPWYNTDETLEISYNTLGAWEDALGPRTWDRFIPHLNLTVLELIR